MHNVIIIGGMAAGCKAAARLSRLSNNFHVLIVEKSPFVSFSTCGLPLYASGELNNLTDLTSTSYGTNRDAKYFRDVKGIEVLVNTEVKAIKPWTHEIECVDLIKNFSHNLSYDSLIIATGSEIKKPPFNICSSPLISSFHSPSDAKNFRGRAQKGEINKAVIIGGGFIGCELAESLISLWGIETVLIEKEDTLLPGCLDMELAVCAESAINSDKIMLLLSTSVEKITEDANGHLLATLDNGQKISADYVFCCPGVKPDTELARKANIKTGNLGGILVDEEMRTSIPGIWAAGDCVELTNLVTGQNDYFSFGSLANRMGRTAADSIAGRRASFIGSAGTFSLKLFDIIISATGLSEKKASACGFETGSVIGCWSDRPDFHPDAKNLVGKMVYDKQGFRLLGIQLMGEGEITRYIDIFSQLLSEHKTIYDLLNLEHGYTPAHSSPVSILNNLGYMVLNQEIEGVENFNPLKFKTFTGTVIDVREPDEVKNYPFKTSTIQIPLSEFRSKLVELKNNPGIETPVLLVCEKGPRAYEASRILLNNCFHYIAYLAGGHYLYDKILGSSISTNDKIIGEKIAGFMENDYER